MIQTHPITITAPPPPPALPFRPISGAIQAPSSGSTSGTSTTSGSGASGLSSTFLQLLTTELQTQDPLNAQDPTTFITQLVGLNSLDQLTQIRNLLAAQAPSTPPSNPPSATGGTPVAAAATLNAGVPASDHNPLLSSKGVSL